MDTDYLDTSPFKIACLKNYVEYLTVGFTKKNITRHESDCLFNDEDIITFTIGQRIMKF